MKRILIFILFCFIFVLHSFSQEIVEPAKEPCLIIFKESPTDTLALVNIERLKNINEKLIYMYELMNIKDSLYSAIDSYNVSTNVKNEIIKLQEKRIKDLSSLYLFQNDLLKQADVKITEQGYKIKQKNKVIWGLGISTGASVALLLIVALVK